MKRTQFQSLQAIIFEMINKEFDLTLREQKFVMKTLGRLLLPIFEARQT